MTTTKHAALDALSTRIQTHINTVINDVHDDNDQLCQAMHYACQGGKHLRGLFIHTIGNLCGATPEKLDAPATAVELIHAYSLIHDDLPAMDDDDVRRGKPSCHVAFGEALAILAGDALQTLAFQVLAENIHVSDNAKVTSIVTLARACGKDGMIKGQSLDLMMHGASVTVETITRIHQYKTAALFSAACELAVIHAGGNAGIRQQWRMFANAIGLAYQIFDDSRDVEKGEQSSFANLFGQKNANYQIMYYYKNALAMLSAMEYPDTSLLTALMARTFPVVVD